MWNRERRAVAAALAVVFAILLPAAITSAWIRGTILSTSGYVAAVTPVAADPEVHAVTETAVTSKVDAALSHAETSLPPPARALAGSLRAGLDGLARKAVGEFMASQAFQRLWADANRLVHSQVISVLNGDSKLLTVSGGEVMLNVLPLVNGVLHDISGRLPAIAGGVLHLPAVTALPAAACHSVTRTLSSACTQIPLFPAAALARPRLAYRALVDVTSLLLVLTPLAFGAALAVSPHRRRTLLQLAIGGTLTVLAVMTALAIGQSSLIDHAGPRVQALTGVLVHALTGGFFTMSTWCVACGYAVIAIALLSDPTARRWLAPALGRTDLTGAVPPEAVPPGATRPDGWTYPVHPARRRPGRAAPRPSAPAPGWPRRASGTAGRRRSSPWSS
jgi:hypothetical protein